MPETVLCRTDTSAAPEVVGAVMSTLRRHGFVVAAPVDLQRELYDRIGAYVPAHVVLFAFNPAATHRVMRSDPAAVAMTIVPVMIRDSDDGVVVEVPDFAGPAEPASEDALAGLRQRLSEALHELSVTT